MDNKGDVAKTVCEYAAKDVESIKKFLEQIAAKIPDFPCDGPYPMMKVDGESYR